MNGMILVWLLGVPMLALYVLLLVFTIRQILSTYRNESVARPAWIVAVIIFPFWGMVAWALWCGIFLPRLREDSVPS